MLRVYSRRRCAVTYVSISFEYCFTHITRQYLCVDYSVFLFVIPAWFHAYEPRAAKRREQENQRTRRRFHCTPASFSVF